jgi:predicted flavoprotein YhiN
MIFSDQSWTNVSSVSMNTLAKMICADEYQVQGKTTFKEEFVTAGGIKLECINQATMESNLIKGLYFAGEVLNVDGITGGYNFQHAWASGWNVANTVSNVLSL